MSRMLANRLRALWLAALLVCSPVGPLGLNLSDHGPGDAAHAVADVHDAAAHAISAGSLPDSTPDPHCLYCQLARLLRFGWVETGTVLPAPATSIVAWHDESEDALDTRLRDAIPARAPPSLTTHV